MERNFYISSFNLSLKRFSRKTKSSLKSGSWPTFLSFLVNTEKITSVVCSHIWAFLVILWLKQRRICMFLKSLKRRGGGISHYWDIWLDLYNLRICGQKALLGITVPSQKTLTVLVIGHTYSHWWFWWTFGLLLGGELFPKFWLCGRFLTLWS